MGVLLFLVLSIAMANNDCSTGCRLTVEKRSEYRDNSRFVVNYEICNKTTHGVVVSPTEIEVKSEGWVSNSSINSHRHPKLASVKIVDSEKLENNTIIFPAVRDVDRCKEKVLAVLWSIDGPISGPDVSGNILPISLSPGASGVLQLAFTHEHAVYGKYEMLFGVRNILIRIGEETFQDRVSIDPGEQLRPVIKLSEPPDDRLSNEQFVSSPSSLHLKAYEQGKQYFRFSDIEVRFGSRVKLTFWYLIARGTAGEFRARIAQYKTTSDYTRVLPGCGFDEELPIVDRWTKVEKIIEINDSATDIGLDFRISTDIELGDVWLDDISVEYVGSESTERSP